MCILNMVILRLMRSSKISEAWAIESWHSRGVETEGNASHASPPPSHNISALRFLPLFHTVHFCFKFYHRHEYVLALIAIGFGNLIFLGYNNYDSGYTSYSGGGGGGGDGGFIQGSQNSPGDRKPDYVNESLRAVTIKQVLEAQQMGDTFNIDNSPVTQVRGGTRGGSWVTS